MIVPTLEYVTSLTWLEQAEVFPNANDITILPLSTQIKYSRLVFLS